MHDRVIHDSVLTDLLCDADTAAWLQAHGTDPRAGYVVSQPVRYRYVRPQHGHYPPTLLRFSRRERLAAWWRRVDWSAWFGVIASLAFIAYLVWEAVR
jgi:hypothetical protein